MVEAALGSSKQAHEKPRGRVVARPLPDRFGFRTGDCSTHTSRTIMRAELTAVFEAVPASALAADYAKAIVEQNALGKRTNSTRHKTAKHLADLYGLDPEITIFRLLRFFWQLDPAGRPLLALLCAIARDPLLRLTTVAVLPAVPGTVVPTADIERAVAEAVPGRFRPTTLHSLAQNAASSWTQSGHLTGVRTKRRSRPVATPGNAAFALALGYLQGSRGQLLLDSFWARLLDVPVSAIASLTASAAQRDWLDYRHLGSIVEVRFPQLLTAAEQEAVHGQD